MDTIKNIAIGGAVTLLVGGTAFTFSQQDVVDNFASETGLSQEQAEQYINDIPDEELVSFDELGEWYISESDITTSIAAEIDCVLYEYDWETPTLTCPGAKKQMEEMATAERATGESYVVLARDSADESDIRVTVAALERLNRSYDQPVAAIVFDEPAIEEMRFTNSYNKSLLTAALESN